MINVARVVVTLAIFALSSQAVMAQTYPAKTVRIIVPQLAGDACDVLSRLLGHKMSERLGQQFVVDNRPGASGSIGLALAVQANADGYTIACGQGGNMSVLPHTMQKIPYDALKDFAPIALIATNYLALVVHPSAPFKNVGDLVKYLKANPGKVAFASNGEGAFLHMATEMFRAHVGGFTYLHVPFKGAAQIHQELMGGRVDATFSSFTAIHPFVTSGKLRLLGIAKATRAHNYPDLPTIAESFPGFASGGWFGLVAPARTPKDIIAILNREANWAMSQPDVREKMTVLGLDIWTESPAYFADLMRSEFDKYGKVVRAIGLTPN